MYMADKKQIKTPPTPRQTLCFLSAWLLGSYLLGMNTFKNVWASVTGCGVLKVKNSKPIFFLLSPLSHFHSVIFMFGCIFSDTNWCFWAFFSFLLWAHECSLFSVKHSSPLLSAGHKLPVFRSNLTWRRLATWTLRLSVALAVVFGGFCFFPTEQSRALKDNKEQSGQARGASARTWDDTLTLRATARAIGTQPNGSIPVSNHLEEQWLIGWSSFRHAVEAV